MRDALFGIITLMSSLAAAVALSSIVALMLLAVMGVV
jgi:hypothetical protein